MAASSVQNPAAVAESKSSKKKKAKGEQRTASPAPVQALSDKPVSVAATDVNGEDLAEPAYLREIAKNIRNVNKKITNASKTDGLIADNKDKSLDELVALKIINADQKAQHLKKPALLAQLAQLEEQYNQLKKIDQDYRQRVVADRAEVTKALTEKAEKEKADAVAAALEKAAAYTQATLHDSLLTLSQFLRLAAARRADEQNSQLDENLALEGVLLQVYAGDETGVATMLKLVKGSDESTRSVAGEPLQTSYAQVKAAAAVYAAPLFQGESSDHISAEPAAAAETDPTLAHASLTEIDAGTDTPLAAATNGEALTNGNAAASAAASAAAVADGHIANADVTDAAANAAGESQWDTAVAGAGSSSRDLSMSQEWIEVPRDPTETETGLTATPAAPTNTQSWADEQPDMPATTILTSSAAATGGAATPTGAAPDSSDGFHQVQRHNRGRTGNNDREGGWRGGRGGGNGGYRGRGRGGGVGGEGGRGRGRPGRGGGNGHNNNNSSNGGGGGYYRGGSRRAEES